MEIYILKKCIIEHILHTPSSACHNLSDLDKAINPTFGDSSSKNIKRRIIPCLSAGKFSNGEENGLCM